MANGFRLILKMQNQINLPEGPFLAVGRGGICGKPIENYKYFLIQSKLLGEFFSLTE